MATRRLDGHVWKYMTMTRRAIFPLLALLTYVACVSADAADDKLTSYQDELSCGDARFQLTTTCLEAPFRGAAKCTRQSLWLTNGMTITGVRPANVTGPDKVRGSVDHVNCITQPARGKPIRFPFADAMRCPIHVDDIAEVFARVLLADKPKHAVYSTGGTAISLGDLADIVRGFLPDARIEFDKPSGGKQISGNYLIDNTRLVQEFGVQYRPYRERVLQIINEVRQQESLPLVRG